MSNNEPQKEEQAALEPEAPDIEILSDSEKLNKLKWKFTSYLQEHTIYETIPENMKILVFNSELTVKDSIDAMIKEDIYCGLLWDTNKSQYVGWFTIRDVLSWLLHSYKKCKTYLIKQGSDINLENLCQDMFKKLDINAMDIDDDLKNITTSDSDPSQEEKVFDDNIKNFNQFLKWFDNVTINNYISLYKSKEQKLITLSLDGNLLDCINLINKNRIHRVVVEDQKSSTVTGFITYEAIFEFFVENYYSEMNEFNLNWSLIDNIITKSIVKLNKTDTICKCLETFYTKKISIIPILDGDEVFGYFYLKDIIYFFGNGDKFTFSDTIEKVLIDWYDDVDAEKPLGKERIVEIKECVNVKELFEFMSICPERKIIARSGVEIGVITLTNIFTSWVNKPNNNNE